MNVFLLPLSVGSRVVLGHEYVNRESVIDHVLSPDGKVLELITASAGVKSAVCRELGGFDEAIRVAGGEDTEFSLRLRAAV